MLNLDKQFDVHEGMVSVTCDKCCLASIEWKSMSTSGCCRCIVPSITDTVHPVSCTMRRNLFIGRVCRFVGWTAKRPALPDHSLAFPVTMSRLPALLLNRTYPSFLYSSHCVSPCSPYHTLYCVHVLACTSRRHRRVSYSSLLWIACASCVGSHMYSDRLFGRGGHACHIICCFPTVSYLCHRWPHV